MSGREAARRIFVAQGELLSDNEALEHIAGMLNGMDWDADLVSQIATLVKETGRDVSRPAEEDDTPGYDADEGEYVDYEEDPDDALVTLSSAMRQVRMATAESYFVGEMFLPDMRVDPRSQGLLGRIVIGGDRGDVWAADATAEEGGVRLTDVEFRTTLDFSGLTDDELREEAEEVIQACYASIQEETFWPTKRER